MANCVIGWPIYSDVGVTYTPALSGGSWLAALPLTNLQDYRLEKLARSTNAVLTSTLFEVDLGVARAIRVFALPRHNFSSAALIRVRGGSVAGLGSGVVYNSGWLPAWPTGETAETTEGMNVGYTLVFAVQTARYWMVEIDDTTNPDGYVDVGRLILAAGWQPTINMALGSGIGVEDPSALDEMDSGAITVNEKYTRRVTRIAIKNLGVDESLTNALKLMRIAGRHRQVHWVWDASDDVVKMHQRAYTGYMRQMNPIEWPEALYTSVGFEIMEAR